MMNIWELPTSLEISGVVWQIRTDYKAIIDILIALDNPEYEEDEKVIIALTIFYPDFEDMAEKDYKEAFEKEIGFITMGKKDEGSQHHARLMDWEQDAPLIIAGINKVVGHEIRNTEMHWWTFLGAYSEIGESAFANVVSIRNKKNRGIRLEKWEKDYFNQNKDAIIIKKKMTEAEKAEDELEQELINELFTGDLHG